MEYSDDEEPKPSVRLSQAQKLRKVIIELVDTERSYVKVNMNGILRFSLQEKQTSKQQTENKGEAQTAWFSRQKPGFPRTHAAIIFSNLAAYL